MHFNENDIVKLTLKGTPREIGLEHGRQLQSQIKSQIATYEEMFQHTANKSWENVRLLAEEFRVSAEKLTPDIYAEMQGIAEGASLNILDIVALNCRSEIAFGFSDGCTSLSWKKSENARVLTQNWDWTTLVKRNLALVSIEREAKPTIYMVTEAGIVGKIGFNTAGVGTCLNAIRSRPCISSKLPIHVALRLCLESNSVEDALQTLSSLGGVANSQHILIADSKTSLGLELSPLGDIHLKEDEFGMVFHTNHFLENQTMDPSPWLPGSAIRLDRARQLSRRLIDDGIKGEKITPALLRQKIFSDTYNAPQSICCQEDMTRHRTMRSCTLFNIVMNLDLQNLGAEVVIGQPGSGKESSVVKIPW
ncbi:hypothetical protein ASPWEDRAFT_49394 [Aspergillus wentii DTO 134E9]|uniref:Peptidase C45 hydrolase domain-containing protein n=1 Tax=Aspergillus wentii DTO 134E9 TaxID=1073089 RepID=A0A1L9RWX6_ASPWE|nr:uncharacterized protein ASPWEDRAFT_49394 [Aspergillus wentii DTO 134E9]KAI9928924.1 hypothetical protein MW887_001317 [Aspergillus wentii]OJJ39393.1 hypothetical protein ASPWEDRAFT_49394 [Aspergillus wentii DTO 134E9]